MAGISRDEVVRRLGRVRYDRFLLYLMGPYRSFHLDHVLSGDERDRFAVEDLPGPLRKLFQSEGRIDEAKALLRRIQGVYGRTPG